MSRINTPAGSLGDLWKRSRVLRRQKLILLVSLTVLFCVPYVALGHHAFFPVRPLPMTFLDRWAGFNPRWVWVYESLYLLTSTLPFLAISRDELRTFVYGFTLLSGTSLLIYFFLPTAVPRPPVPHSTGLYRLLLAYDGPYNACPSLHAGFIYFNLAFTVRVCGRPRFAVGAVMLLWAALILWATLATKEHYAVDLLAGVALAAVCDAAAWQRRFRNVAVRSQGGLR